MITIAIRVVIYYYPFFIIIFEGLSKLLKPISSFLVNEQGVVGKIKTKDKNIINSLKQLNIRIGSKIKVINKEKGQPILVGISDGRVGLNASLAACIYVLNN